MKRLLILAVLLAGCSKEKDREIARLQSTIQTMVREQAETAKALPTERPAVLDELDKAKKRIAELQSEVEATRIALAQAKEATKGEVLPLSAWMKAIDAQLADHNARINACSRKGHTHTYHKGDSPFHSNTGPD